ncbi:uncharacterized protein LOC133185118 [Saccostrea echinata]|uniref:uncharacterized protein LOC133185118 n=1 Tax=Saccostrea echinata TaxID=191078 RepID=UPI002A841975|nr:uncharacterized protein LOC133185118 [Saccostrea echinata]
MTMATECRTRPSVSEEELFGNGPEEPAADIKEQLMRTISREGERRKKEFRTSKNDKEFEEDSDRENDDVFVGVEIHSEVRKERSKSDSNLPDLVLSSASTHSEGDLEAKLNSEDSPDVVVRKISTSSGRDGETKDGSQGDREENQSIVGPLPITKDKSPKFRRSVSFQDQVKDRKDSNSNMDTENRRKEYRMSSGYGTGGSNTSLQSQMSNVSNISQETEGDVQQHTTQKLTEINNPTVLVDKGLDPSQESKVNVQQHGTQKLMEINNPTVLIGKGLDPVVLAKKLEPSGISKSDECIEMGRSIKWRGSVLPLMYEGDKTGVRIVPRGGLQQEDTQSPVRSDQSSVNGDDGWVINRDVNEYSKLTLHLSVCFSFTLGDDEDQTAQISNLIPEVVTSILNQPSVEDTAPNDLLPNLSIMQPSNVGNSPVSHQEEGSTNSSHEGVDPKACSQEGGSNSPCAEGANADDLSHHDSSVLLPEFEILLDPKTPDIANMVSPSLKLSKEKVKEIFTQYCARQPSLPSSAGLSVNLQIPDRVPATPDIPLTRQPPSTGHSSYGISQIASAFFKNPEIFNFEVESLQNLVRLFGTPTSGLVIREGSLASDVSVPCVEIASRCKDRDCSLRKCQMMKAALIGLQHALDGFLEISASPDVQNLCISLYEHAKNCEEPPIRCTIPWCYLLRRFSEVEGVTSYTVFYWMKRQFDTPVCDEDVFPEEDLEHFIKLESSHHHTESTSFEVISRIEQPGHYGNVALVSEVTPPLASFDSEMSTTDPLYVIKQISNDESDFEVTRVFERLRDLEHPNLIHHYWIAVYQSHTNICLQYIQGDTLETELQRRMLFAPHMVLQMMREVLGAVDFLHRNGIIYLYWSLGNILLDSLHRRLIINNLTLSVTDDELYDVGYTKQSLPPSLVPPEMFEDETLTHDSDCWGAACVMVHLLSGHQIWYSHRHDSREELWEKVRSGCSPFTSEEVKIKEVSLLVLLKECFKLKVSERICFAELLRRIKSASADGNFGHLSGGS